jgi:hypothetical protein
MLLQNPGLCLEMVLKPAEGTDFKELAINILWKLLIVRLTTDHINKIPTSFIVSKGYLNAFRKQRTVTENSPKIQTNYCKSPRHLSKWRLIFINIVNSMLLCALCETTLRS